MIEEFIPGAFWTYVVLFFSIIILGNTLAFSALLLAFLGGLGRWGMFSVTLTIILADLSGDSLWFLLGKTLHNTKLGNFIKRHLPHNELIERHLHEDSLKWLYLSKFISSVTAPFLFLLGWSQNVSTKKFFKTNLTTTIVWIVILLVGSTVVGSGLLPFVTAESLKKAEVTITIIVITVFALQILLRYLSKKTAFKNFIKKIVGTSNN